MSRCAVMRPAARSVLPSSNFSRTSASEPLVSKLWPNGATPRRAQCFKFLAPQRDQFAFFLHDRRPNVAGILDLHRFSRRTMRGRDLIRSNYEAKEGRQNRAASSKNAALNLARPDHFVSPSGFSLLRQRRTTKDRSRDSATRSWRWDRTWIRQKRSLSPRRLITRRGDCKRNGGSRPSRFFKISSSTLGRATVGSVFTGPTILGRSCASCRSRLWSCIGPRLIRTTHLEHNVVVVTALGQPCGTGYIIDAWRAAGRLLWWPVSKDEYPWKENPQVTAWLQNKGPDPIILHQPIAPAKAQASGPLVPPPARSL